MLNVVEPDVLVLGKKDYQQLCVVRRMVRDLDMGVTVIGGETARAEGEAARACARARVRVCVCVCVCLCARVRVRVRGSAVRTHAHA